MKPLNRRAFLARSAALGAFAATPGVTTSQVLGTSGGFADYRALVCVFLFGGNDSFNMLVPRSDAEYGVYARARQNLAVAQDALLPVVPLSGDGVDYGLHPAMPDLKTLFDTGAAAFVANLGPLIRPVSKDEFLQGSAPLPPQLFSHNDQQDQWQSLKGRSQTRTGWAGRMADLLRTRVSGQQMATNASLFGTNLFQSADATVAYVMGPAGPLQFEGFSTAPGSFEFQQREAFLNVLRARYGSVYERAFVEVQQRAIEEADTITAAMDAAPAIATPFPDSELGRQLNTVARLVAVRDRLGMRRQVFFVATGGFDSHDNQNEDQPGLLAGVSEAMKAFYDATVELGVAESVTSFTQSDFGRTLTSNGDGTDHAWGGNQIVVGGSVLGREIYGAYPLLELDSELDVGGGRIIPSLAADQYAATLARWFGIPIEDLPTVAPHIDNFAQTDLGFLV